MKKLDTYTVYFLISVCVSVVLLFANWGAGFTSYALIIVGSFLTPYLFELDYIFYIYLVAPEKNISRESRAMVSNGNIAGALFHLHDHKSELSDTVLRSVVSVITFFSIGFLITFAVTNLLAASSILSFVLTLIYYETVSFFDSSWRNWYEILQVYPKEKYAKLFLGAQYIIFLVFLFKVI